MMTDMKKLFMTFSALTFAFACFSCQDENYEKAVDGVERTSETSAVYTTVTAGSDDYIILQTTASGSVVSGTSSVTSVSYTSLSSVNNTETTTGSSHSVTDNSDMDSTVTTVSEADTSGQVAVTQGNHQGDIHQDFALPVDLNGNLYTGHGEMHPEDMYESLNDGLHKSAVMNDGEIQSLVIDNSLVQVGHFTGNDFINTAEHEWHFYSKGGALPEQVEPGKEAFYHLDSDYFSADSNKKVLTPKKNGQVVFYVKNNTDMTLSAMDCPVYKIYVSYASHGVENYSEIPVVDYFGMQILDSAESVKDGSFFGDCRKSEIIEGGITRYEYGTLSETYVWIDVMPYDNQDIFAGITIACLM